METAVHNHAAMLQRRRGGFRANAGDSAREPAAAAKRACDTLRADTRYPCIARCKTSSRSIYRHTKTEWRAA